MMPGSPGRGEVSVTSLKFLHSCVYPAYSYLKSDFLFAQFDY